MKKLVLAALIAVVLLSSVGCGSEVLQSGKRRVTSPDVAESDLARQVAGNSAFAFDLYRALADMDGNLFFSLHSLSLALAMTYAGARGETECQMADTLHFVLPQDALHPVLNELDTGLNSRGEDEDDGLRLSVANAIWGQEGEEFLTDFLDVLAENYGAGLRQLDFENAPEQSRLTINDWASDETEGRIRDLIPQGAIGELTRLVLANAVYFKAKWQYAFDEGSTVDGLFYLANGDGVTVPMMRQTESLGYADGDTYQAVELPYLGDEASMVLLLPRHGQFEAFEGSLGAEMVDSIIGDLADEKVALMMPRFEFDSEFKLSRLLAAMGMPDAFGGAADFSGMTGSRGLYIDDVIHKTFVSVDEYGTEAAAATAVMMVGSAPGAPVAVTVDRPFIFLIRDIETGTFLFVGRVMDPRE